MRRRRKKVQGEEVAQRENGAGPMVFDSVIDLLMQMKRDLSKWGAGTKPWFRGESGNQVALLPRIAEFDTSQENHLMHSFLRQAGGLANVPFRRETDLWLFLAQHYGVPTRLLDWTEGVLHAVYFAINRGNPDPRVYMLHPRRLNEIAGSKTTPPNFPLSWYRGGSLYVALAWQNRALNEKQVEVMEKIPIDLEIPLAFPATYQDQRMIAQRSCFTIHGSSLRPLAQILIEKKIDIDTCLTEYKIKDGLRDSFLRELSIMGVSAATIFPDLDHLAIDLVRDFSLGDLP